MTTENQPDTEPANLRLLRRLVTTLMIVLIIGFVIIVGLFVMRFGSGDVQPDLPDAISLPDGTRPKAVTYGDGWIAVVAADQLLFYDASSGALIKSVEIALP